MGMKADLAARKADLKVLEQQNTELERLKSSQLELLKSTKLTKSEWNNIQAKVRDFDAQIGKTTSSMNSMATDIEKVEGGIGKAEKRLENFGSKAQDLAKKVPVIGESLAAGIGRATDKAKMFMDKWLKKTDTGTKRTFKILGGILGGLLLGGIFAMWKLFSSMLEKSKETMMEMSTAMNETGRALQMSVGDVKQIGKGVGDWVRYGSGWASSVAQIREDMGYIPDLTKAENKLIGRLATNAGLGADQIANMYRHSQSMGVSLDSYVKNQEKKINLLNLEMGVHFTQAEIVKEIAGASDATLAMFGKQNQELERQVLIGKKIGLNLNQQASMAKSLLDIETSIESEMEARVLTGKELNFDKARELALSGDIGGAASEVMEQVGGINEFQEMNIIQKEALAKAAGMEVGQLQKALEKQAGLTDQASMGPASAGGGGAGLDAASGNVDMTGADEGRKRRWGAIFMKAAEAIRNIKKGLEERLLVWFESGAGKDMADDINTFMTDIDKWVNQGIVPEWWTTFKTDWLDPVFKFFNDWGGTLLTIAGALTGAALLKKGWDWGKSMILGKLGSSSNPMYVKIGQGGIVDSVLDMFKKKNKPSVKTQKARSNLKNKIKKTKVGGWFRNIKAGFKKAKRKLTSPLRSISAKFSKAKKKITGSLKNAGKSIWGKVSGWGKKAWGGVKKAGGKAWTGIKSLNPIAKLKKVLPSKASKFMGKAAKMGGKFAKGGLIGAILNMGSLASIFADSKTTPLEKAKKIIPLGASILGGGLGAIAGSIVPVVGTFGGSVLGSFIGDWIGNMPKLQNALAPPLAKLLGGAEDVDDFILSDRGLIKFRKDDLVVGGTKLNEALGNGDNEKLDEVVQLLAKLIKVCQQDRVMSVDGLQLSDAIDLAKVQRGF